MDHIPTTSGGLRKLLARAHGAQFWLTLTQEDVEALRDSTEAARLRRREALKFVAAAAFLASFAAMTVLAAHGHVLEVRGTAPAVFAAVVSAVLAMLACLAALMLPANCAVNELRWMLSPLSCDPRACEEALGLMDSPAARRWRDVAVARRRQLLFADLQRMQQLAKTQPSPSAWQRLHSAC